MTLAWRIRLEKSEDFSVADTAAEGALQAM
jgi:hypothetical protein